jgi:hypothetical protein
VLVAIAPFGTAAPCTPATNTSATTAAALASGVGRSGRFCSQNETDFFSFLAAANGTVSVTATDTPVKVTIVSTGAQTTIASGGTGSLATPGGSVIVRVEPAGTVGANASYTITATYLPAVNGRRRTSR